MRRCVSLFLVGLALYVPASTVAGAQDPPSSSSTTTLAFSTYFGQFGSDEATDLAVGADGSVYVVGWSQSVGSTGSDAFLVKLASDGSQIDYTRYLRGNGFDIAMGVQVDASGAVYIVGHTTSTDFPLLNPIQSERRGESDVWIAKLDASGTLVYATYYGGYSFENAYAVAIDASGDVYVAGSTGSTDLPGVNGYQRVNGGGFGDGFVLKVTPDGSAPQYATYLGGGGEDAAANVAVDSGGQAYVVGYTNSTNFPIAAALQPAFGGGFNDGFVTKLSPDGGQLVFSTYLGGVDRDAAVALAVDQDGAIHVGGSTRSYNFPTRNAYQPYLGGGFADAFVTRMEPDGAALVYSTFLGGAGFDMVLRIALDDGGSPHLVGQTDSANFPMIEPVQGQVNWVDGFFAQFSPDGQALSRSTPLGGTFLETAAGLALLSNGDVWIAGRTDSDDFPVVNALQPLPGGSGDAFIARLTLGAPANQPPVAVAGRDQRILAYGCAVHVYLDGRLSSDPDGDALQYVWTGNFQTVTGATAVVDLIPGIYTITLTVDDGHGGTSSDTVVVTVVDSSPPQIVSAIATPDALGPPNHQMASVSVNLQVYEPCGETSTCRIIGVMSTEPINGLGDGDTAPDWEITGPLTLLLRAERGGQSEGRIYTITVECVDGAGNTSQTSVTVSVAR
jgi:hypothetical protein